MNRREYIALAGSAMAWPPAVLAQQSDKVFRIARFSAGLGVNPEIRSAFVDALRELGWLEGKNIVLEDRHAENRLDRLPELAAELVRLNVDVILAAGTLAPLAAKQATTTIPIVLANAGDPVGSGLVASLAKPGGNITGLSLMAPELGGKRLEILKEVLPNISRVAVLWNAANPYSALVLRETQAAAKKLSIHLEPLEVRSPDDFDTAFSSSVAQRVEAIIAVEDPLTFGHRKLIAEFSTKNRVPGIYGLREFVDSGGFLAYGANVAELYRRAAGYVDKILKGAKPADLPVEQPTKFELVINLKTAKALGITVPLTLLARADEVIE
jgi:putative ABC transport system substrate-binding protein